ncbi:MAG: PEGA domain-containing protein [Planctomycetaceae bacterium]
MLPSRPLLLILLLAVCAAATTGCVHRRLTIRSQPAGAQVFVDGKDAGYTPTAVDFTYYATREVRLVKPGFETQTQTIRLPEPWYQVPPLDFLSDNLMPIQVTNRNEFQFSLQPQVVVPRGELLERANTLRTEARIGVDPTGS